MRKEGERGSGQWAVASQRVDEFHPCVAVSPTNRIYSNVAKLKKFNLNMLFYYCLE